MTRYEQGFMNKCAEYGVDGEKLLKRAWLRQPGPFNIKRTEMHGYDNPFKYVSGKSLVPPEAYRIGINLPFPKTPHPSIIKSLRTLGRRLMTFGRNRTGWNPLAM